MAQNSIGEFNHVKLHTAGARVRALANLLIGYCEDSSPIDFSIWPEIGLMLDELGSEIIFLSNELEGESVRKVSELQPRKRK